MKNISSSDYERMIKGEVIFSGGKGFIICVRCDRIISVTGFFGSIHLCAEDS